MVKNILGNLSGMFFTLDKWHSSLLVASLAIVTVKGTFAQEKLPAWRPGYFDIHHINTGSGNAAFMIFPDGTTLLFDAGEIKRNASSFGLKYSPRLPHDTISAATCIVNYCQQVLPGIQTLDYAVISHFHPDHFGAIDELSPRSKHGEYRLSGITEVYEYLPIRTLIDRNYPTYDFPVDIRTNTFDRKTFENYLAFINANKEHLKVEAVQVGNSKQIKPQKNLKNFAVQNICSNGTVWSGASNNTLRIVPDSIDAKDYNENPLSIGLKFSYGSFDYFTAGDLTGLRGFNLPPWFDLETHVAPVVGKIEALSLNHHGVRDAMNEVFLQRLAPRVLIQQSWSSNHPGEEVLHRMISTSTYPGQRSIFATFVHDATASTYGKWLTDNYSSMRGHVVIRVLPDGKEFYVYVMHDSSLNINVLKRHGPFKSYEP